MRGDKYMEIENLIQEKLRTVYKDNSLIFDKSRFAGGLTNYNYIMDIHGKEYVIRQPGEMTHLMIDRNIEQVNNQIASEIGINSECIYFDSASGIKISIYIKDSQDIAKAGPCCFENIDIVLDLMKRIHSSPKPFPNYFDWEKELSKYENLVLKVNGEFFSDYIEYKNRLLDFINRHVKNTTLVPCHNDTVPENFLVDNKGQSYLIDWEYSGMNDPSWDLAAYILESQLTEKAIDYLLKGYYGEEPSLDEILKIKSYMMAQDLLWMVWAMIRHYCGGDFLTYCNLRYERFKKNVDKLTDSTAYPISHMVR